MANEKEGQGWEPAATDFWGRKGHQLTPQPIPTLLLSGSSNSQSDFSWIRHRRSWQEAHGHFVTHSSLLLKATACFASLPGADRENTLLLKTARIAHLSVQLN